MINLSLCQSCKVGLTLKIQSVYLPSQVLWTEQPGGIRVRGKKDKMYDLGNVRSKGRKVEVSIAGQARSMLWWKRRKFQELIRNNCYWAIAVREPPMSVYHNHVSDC